MLEISLFVVIFVVLGLAVMILALLIAIKLSGRKKTTKKCVCCGYTFLSQEIKSKDGKSFCLECFELHS